MMTDRTGLAARMAEAMGWEYNEDTAFWRDRWGCPWEPIDIGGWDFYGIIDQFMRDQGYRKTVETTSTYGAEGVWVRWYGPDGQLRGIAADPAYDEPRAAIEAALKALGESDG